MSLRITEDQPAASEEWGYIWENCDYATYYHSREWAEIWQKYTQGVLRPDARRITFSDGKSALLSFSSRRIYKGLSKQYVLSPAGTYGGWLSLNILSESHGRLLHKHITTHYKYLTWRLNPYNSFEISLNTKEVRNDETHTLNLECGFEVIHKEWTKGHASAVRKARKAGVKIREAITLQDWGEYYRIYEDSLERWGESASSRYGWRLFQCMHDLSSSNIKLWLATSEDQVVAGALCLYAKNHVGYWHGSALAKYYNLRPVNLLMYEIINNSCARGYQWFDFNPSGGHEGVRAFKKSFGAKARESPIMSLTPLHIKFPLIALGKTKEALRKIKNISHEFPPV